MELIIQPEEVGILARPLSQHIDREQLVAYITEVEQLQIRSALGGILFAEIKQSPSTFDIILNGGSDEVGEVIGGIRMAMAYYVYARVIREGGTIPTRWGAVEKTDEYATRLDQEQKNTIYRECNNIADAYMAEVVNYAKAQGWMDAQGANPTRRMAYVVGSEEADADKMPCKSRQSVNANLVAGDGINIVDGEISVNMGEVQRGTGMTALAQRVTNAETNIEEVRRLATQREEVTVGNGLIKDDKGSISVDFEVVASNAEITNIRTTANEAKTEARQAKKLAEDAISTLEAINQIASDAETTAQRAKTEADSAVTTAVDAVGVAGSALTTAGQATETANDALLKANSAQTSATNAENSAKASALSASSAKTSAENAKKSAEEVAKGISSIDGKVSESVSKAVDGAFGDVNQALTKQAEELETKAPKVGYAPDLKVDFAKELVGRGVAEPQEIGVIRPTGEISIGDGNATIEKVKGKSVVWNQLYKAGYYSTSNDTFTQFSEKTINGVTFSLQNDGAIKVNGTASANAFLILTMGEQRAGRKILLKGCPQGGSASTYGIADGALWLGYADVGNGSIIRTNTTGYQFSIFVKTGVTVDDIIFRPQFSDLTQMFGVDNEPTTIEEFEARKPLGVTNDYNEGEIISYDGANELKSVGINAWDEEWEVGTLHFNTDTSNFGENNDASKTNIRSKNYIPVLPNQKYFFKIGTGTNGFMIAYDADMIAIKTAFSNGRGASGNAHTMPSNCHYVKFYCISEYGIAYKHDICIHLVHTGYRNGEYQPYEEDILRLPNIKAIKDKDGNQLFPYGLLSAGSAYDEITATKAVKRIGVVDMGTLTWYTQVTANGNTRFLADLSGIKRPLQSSEMGNVLTPKYQTYSADKVYLENVGISVDVEQYKALSVYDPNYTEKDSFKQSMQGTLLYYELATPIEVDLPEPLNLTYDAWDFGTEELIAEGATTPLNADIVYQFNAVDRIRENTTNVSEIEEEVATKQQELTLTVLDNGNIRIGNLQGQTKDFMPATPSGDPMHYAYVSAGAEYNDSGADIIKTGVYGDKIIHKAGYWCLNEIGDLSTQEMAEIYSERWASQCTPFAQYFWHTNSRTVCIDLATDSSLSNYTFYHSYNIEKLKLTSNKNNQIKLSANAIASIISLHSLTKILTILIANNTTAFTSWFDGCLALEEVRITGLKCNISFKACSNISQTSILYMIEKAAPTSAITITLHADAYARLAEDADIVAALEAKPLVTIVSA